MKSREERRHDLPVGSFKGGCAGGRSEGGLAVLDTVEGTRTDSSAANRLLLEVTVLKTFKSRRKHQVDLYIPNRGNPRVIIKGPEGERADIHFEWFESEKATKIAEMIAAGFSAKET